MLEDLKQMKNQRKIYLAIRKDAIEKARIRSTREGGGDI